MKKTFGKVLVALLVSVAFVGLAGCNNNADGGGGGSGGYTPKISSQAEMNVLGTYKNGGKTYTFNDDLTGSYDDDTSANSRAITKGNFTWSMLNGTKIKIEQNGQTIEASFNNGQVTIENETFNLQGVQESDIRGKTYTLIYPSIGEMDTKTTRGGWYITKVAYAASGYGVTATVRVVGYDNQTHTGTWSLNGSTITLNGTSGGFAGGAVKVAGDKGYVWANFGLEIFQRQ